MKAKITFEISFLLLLNVVYSKVILFIFSKVLSNFKIYERVISALILVASFARPKISSQFLRVNGILKFSKNSKFIFKICDLNFKNL